MIELVFVLMLFASGIGYVVGYWNGRDAEWQRQFDRRSVLRKEET